MSCCELGNWTRLGVRQISVRGQPYRSHPPVLSWSSATAGTACCHEHTMSCSRFWAPKSQIKLLRKSFSELWVSGALITSGMQPNCRHMLVKTTCEEPWGYGPERGHHLGTKSTAVFGSQQHSVASLLAGQELFWVILGSPDCIQHPRAHSAHWGHARRWQQHVA